MKGKKTVLTLLLSATLAMTAGCGKSETTGGTGEKVIHVGTDAAYAPFEYLDNGKIVGFDIDFLAAVMKEAGLKYDLKNTGWEPLFASVKTGEIDMGISAITINDDRKKTYDFSAPYFESTQMIMVKEGSSVKKAEDLKQLKKVGVQTGTTGAEAAESLLGKNSSQISKYENNVLAIMALKSGEVEAVVADNGVVKEYVKNNPKDKIVAIEDKASFASEYYGLMFKKGNKDREKIDAAVQKIIENGTYAEIYKKWFNTEPDTAALKNAK